MGSRPAKHVRQQLSLVPDVRYALNMMCGMLGGWGMHLEPTKPPMWPAGGRMAGGAARLGSANCNGARLLCPDCLVSNKTP